MAEAHGDEDQLVVELHDPVYDPEAQKLTYHVKVLADYSGAGLAHAALQQQDATFFDEFGRGSLFIDDCANNDLLCYGKENKLCGTLQVEQCSNPSFNVCAICNDPGTICKAAFPDCI